ncbi:MAG TPA: hypothetical protein VFR85_21710 [Anaeromyxobacteraceae bacterium]|nr:hypothetical protein [Anaeromyxobacteraceae bacterium]
MTAPVRWLLALLAAVVVHAALAYALHLTASRPESHIGPLVPSAPPPAGGGR